MKRAQWVRQALALPLDPRTGSRRPPRCGRPRSPASKPWPDARRGVGTGASRPSWRKESCSLRQVRADTLLPGRKHERFAQIYKGVRVFGGELVRQSDDAGVVSVFGTFYEGMDIDVRPDALGLRPPARLVETPGAPGASHRPRPRARGAARGRGRLRALLEASGLDGQGPRHVLRGRPRRARPHCASATSRRSRRWASGRASSATGRR